MDKITQVIDAAGGVGALAARLNVKPPTVYQWKKGTRPVPARLALQIQQVWPDIASAKDLRPDIFGPPPATEAA